MFLAAVACPCYDSGRHQWFDGLIGIQEFVEEIEAQRTSINRPAGTMERVSIDKVTNKDHKDTSQQSNSCN